MKDNNYYNDNMYVYTNKDTKQTLKKIADNEKTNMYDLVDEGIRKVAKERGEKLPQKPKKAQLI